MKEQYDDYIEDDDYEYETGDTFVENIDDEENFLDDDNANLIFKIVHQHKNRFNFNQILFSFLIFVLYDM
jgi:hypothetical protein